MIKLSEIFYSLQGEGYYNGHPSIFVRTAHCNLNCGFNNGVSTWKCDTWNIMNKANLELAPEELAKRIHELDPSHRSRVVFTGGEPFIQGDAIAETIRELKKLNYPKAKMDFETNGTIFNGNVVKETWGVITISPKLRNSGIEDSKRFNKEVLENFIRRGRILFKFVISNEEDVKEILEEYVPFIEGVRYGEKNKNPVIFDWRNISYFMPAMETIEEGKEVKKFVWQKCMELGVPMTLRSHIEVYDKKAGV